VALNLSKLSVRGDDVDAKPIRRRGGCPSQTAGAADTAAPPPKVPAVNFGRSAPPPPPGSPYSAFLDWASEDGLPIPGDEALATRLWMGLSDTDPSNELPRPPGM